MTESELDEIKTAINAAKQFSEDNPEGMYERLLIACIPVMELGLVAHMCLQDGAMDEMNALSIARAINNKL